MVKKFVSLFLLLTFSLSSTLSVQAQGIVSPVAAVKAQLPVIYGLKTFPRDPFRFEFLIDKGQEPPADDRSAPQEYNRLVKYFFTSLTVAEKNLWVNLSPLEADRVIAPDLARTDMGRDLLAQDLVLKQMTAEFLSPDNKAGRVFWDRVYGLLKEKYGTADVPLDTINKIWITPGKAVVHEHDGAAMVLEARLKVMLEVDHQASVDLAVPAGDRQDLPRQIMREVVVPAIEDEVNNAPSFATLRQVYHSLILAAWYKRKIRESILARQYVDQGKVAGLQRSSAGGQKAPDEIYKDYIAAYRSGMKGMVVEERDRDSGEIMPRQYATGGFSGDMSRLSVIDDPGAAAAQAVTHEGNSLRVAVLARRDTPQTVERPPDASQTTPVVVRSFERRLGEARILPGGRIAMSSDIAAQIFSLTGQYPSQVYVLYYGSRIEVDLIGREAWEEILNNVIYPEMRAQLTPKGERETKGRLAAKMFTGVFEKKHGDLVLRFGAGDGIQAFFTGKTDVAGVDLWKKSVIGRTPVFYLNVYLEKQNAGADQSAVNPAQAPGGIDLDTGKVPLEIRQGGAEAPSRVSSIQPGGRIAGLSPVVVNIRPAGPLTDYTGLTP